MKLFCPRCNTEIFEENINDYENICICSNCNELFDLSIILDQLSIEKIERMLISPPNGSWVKNNNGHIIIEISIFSKLSIPELIFHFLFSSITFFGFFQLMIDFSILYSLLMIPFVIFSIWCIKRAFYLLFNKIKILFLEDNNIQIFIGIWKFGKKYCLNLKLIKKIFKLQYRDPNYDPETVNQKIKQEIHIEEKDVIKIPLEYMNKTKATYLINIIKYSIYKSLKY